MVSLKKSKQNSWFISQNVVKRDRADDYAHTISRPVDTAAICFGEKKIPRQFLPIDTYEEIRAYIYYILEQYYYQEFLKIN